MKNIKILLIITSLIFFLYSHIFGHEPDDSFNLTGKSMNKTGLTDREKAWIRVHPSITLGADISWPPFDMTNENGKHSGLSADYIELIQEKTGLTINVWLQPWNLVVSRAMNHEIDGIISCFITEERKKSLAFSNPYFTAPLAIYVLQENRSYEKLTDFHGKTLALPKGSSFISFIRKNHPRIKIYETVNALDSLTAISEGRADGAGDMLAAFHYLTLEYFFSNVKPAFIWYPERNNYFHIAVRNDQPLLLSIINKGLAAITKEEHMQIRQKWMGDISRLPVMHGPDVPGLTINEITWLRNNKKLGFGIMPLCPPFEIIGKNGKSMGISRDYTNIISKKLDLIFNESATFSPGTSGSIKSGEIDIVSGIISSPQSLKNFLLTKPFYSSALVLVTLKNAQPVNELKEIHDKVLSAARNLSIREKLESDYPDLEIKLYEDSGKALIAVSEKEVFGMIGDINSINYLTHKLGLENIKINNTIPYQLDLCFGVRKDMPELLPILEKTLDSISWNQKNIINDRWTNIPIEIQTDWDMLIHIVLVISGMAAGIILIFIAWNRRLSSEVIERKRMETRYRNLVEDLGGDYCIYGLTFTAEFNYISPSAKTMFGIDPEKAIGMKWQKLADWFPESLETGNKTFESIRQGKKYPTDEMKYLHPDGSVRFIDVTGHPIIDQAGNIIGAGGIARDITKAKRLYHERNWLFNYSIDMQGIVGFNGYFKQLNSAWEKTLGWTKEEMFSKSWKEFLHPEDLEASLAEEKNIMKNKISTLGFENRYICKDGSARWLSWSTQVSYKDRLYFVIARDVTDKKKADEELRAAKDAAESANRAKSTFLANMSHEIRTPMNAILGFTDIMDGKINDRHLKEYLAHIRSSGKSLLSLINDILDLSKVEAGKTVLEYDDIDIRSLLLDIKGIFSGTTAEKKLEFILDISSDLPEYLVLDEIRLRQVLFNLVGNAVKFTSTGHIRLAVHVSALGDDFGTADIFLAVEDTGIGIPGENKDKIFKAFEQQGSVISTDYGGTGLGLAISLRLAEMMNGSISVRSEPGKGSIFTLILKDVKIGSYPGKYCENTDPVPLSIEFHDKLIMIADDVAFNRLLLKTYLEKYNFEFIEAENGKEAVRLARLHHPDLVLMDIKMPVMDGRQATLEIKGNNKTKDIPVIAVTASAMKESEQELKALCDAYLAKPVNENDLVSQLRKFLRHSINSGHSIDTASLQDKEISEPAAYNPGKEVINKLPALPGLLDTGLMVSWEEINDTLIMDDIKEFAARVQEIGKEYSINLLIDYSLNLLAYARSYNIPGIKKQVEDFPRLIEQVNQMITDFNISQEPGGNEKT